VWKSVFLGVLCEAGAHEDSIVALKCYKLDDKEAINAAIMRDVLKPNVLIKQRSNYLSHSRKIGEENGKIWLRETLWTGTLHDLIVHGGPSRNIIEVVEMGSQLFQGLAALHSHNLRHTDLKPDNCGFIQEERHKRRYLIGDFGCLSSEPTKVPEDLRLLGTQRTRAPEVWSDPNSISLKADVWALAACLYAVCMRKYPFLPYDLERGSTEERRAREEDIRAHLGGLSTAFQDDVQQNLPPVLTEVLLPCFAQSPSLRPESATVAGFFMGLRSSLSSQEDKSVLQGWQRSEDVLGQLRLTLGSPGEAGSASQRVAFLPELEWLINDATRFVPPSTLATLKSFAAER
jgi:serine/threonine protein kinase